MTAPIVVSMPRTARSKMIGRYMSLRGRPFVRMSAAVSTKLAVARAIAAVDDMAWMTVSSMRSDTNTGDMRSMSHIVSEVVYFGFKKVMIFTGMLDLDDGRVYPLCFCAKSCISVVVMFSIKNNSSIVNV